jgi:hypothetical protein
MITMIVQRGCQAFDTEKRALHQASMLLDGYEVTLTAISSISSILRSQADGLGTIDPKHYLPAGSVEFMREAFAAFNLEAPADLDYPVASEDELQRILGRSVRRVAVTEGMAGLFIKPVVTKAFSAKVYDEVPTEIIGQEAWVSDPVLFGHEWRVYVLHGRILGHAQYDHGEETPLSHEGLGLAGKVINLMEQSPTKPPSAYAIDVGLVGKRYVLVELNDGWATGFYPGAIKPAHYLNWLQSRWMDICESSKTNRSHVEDDATGQYAGAIHAI